MRRQLARHERLVAILLELLALRRLELVEIFVDAFERSVLADQRLRALLADAGNAGDVVDGVAPDGHDVDDFLRRQAERFLDAFRVVQHFAAGVVERDAVADELEEILVGGGDDDVVAAVARDAGQRCR